MPSNDPIQVPPRLGPYRVTGLWHSDDVGVVLDGHGPDGRVELVLLAPAPSMDATARDRFRGAAASEDRKGGLLANGSDEQTPWVALAPGSGPRGAQPLLAPVMPEPAGDDAKGPDYQPHWKGQPNAYPLRPMPLPGHARLPWWWWLVGFLLALALFLLLASCVPKTPSPPPPTGGSGTSTGGSPTSGTGSPTSGSGTSTESPTSSSSPSDSGSGSPTSSDPSGSPSPSDSSSESETGGPGGTGTPGNTIAPNPSNSF